MVKFKRRNTLKEGMDTLVGEFDDVQQKREAEENLQPKGIKLKHVLIIFVIVVLAGLIELGYLLFKPKEVEKLPSYRWGEEQDRLKKIKIYGPEFERVNSFAEDLRDKLISGNYAAIGKLWTDKVPPQVRDRGIKQVKALKDLNGLRLEIIKKNYQAKPRYYHLEYSRRDHPPISFRVINTKSGLRILGM